MLKLNFATLLYKFRDLLFCGLPFFDVDVDVDGDVDVSQVKLRRR